MYTVVARMGYQLLQSTDTLLFMSGHRPPSQDGTIRRTNTRNLIFPFADLLRVFESAFLFVVLVLLIVTGCCTWHGRPLKPQKGEPQEAVLWHDGAACFWISITGLGESVQFALSRNPSAQLSNVLGISSSGRHVAITVFLLVSLKLSVLVFPGISARPAPLKTHVDQESNLLRCQGRCLSSVKTPFLVAHLVDPIYRVIVLVLDTYFVS